MTLSRTSAKPPLQRERLPRAPLALYGEVPGSSAVTSAA